MKTIIKYMILSTIAFFIIGCESKNEPVLET